MRSTAIIIDPTPEDERDVMIASNGRKMRSPLQIERDREYEARAYLAGETMDAIAQQLGISPAAVGKDIMAIRDEWANSRISNYDFHVNIELARIDALEQEYWHAYRASQAPKRTVHRSVKDEPNTGRGKTAVVYSFNEDGEPIENVHLLKPKPLRSRKVVTETPSHGNLAALAGIERCIEARRRLLGLDAPQKTALTTPDGKKPYDPISNETRAAALLSTFLANRLPQGDAGEPQPERLRIADGHAPPGGSADD